MARLRPPSVDRLTLFAGIVAALATFAFLHEVTEASPTTSSLPAQGDSPYASDERGFTHSSARCDGALGAVAFARTQSSLVAICTDGKGKHQYRGVRLSDGAALNVSAEPVRGREFVAHNDGITYELSAKQLVITSRGTVIRREPVLEYRDLT